MSRTLQAVLCRNKNEEAKDIGISLTRDHNPTVFEERMRIEKAGGHVKYVHKGET